MKAAQGILRKSFELDLLSRSKMPVGSGGGGPPGYQRKAARALLFTSEHTVCLHSINFWLSTTLCHSITQHWQLLYLEKGTSDYLALMPCSHS